MTLRVALCARVSTHDKGQDPEMQLRELREYCQRRGWTIAGEYVDIGVCGAKDSRPELNRLMADASRRKLDAVVVWRFDRFARSVSHMMRALETFRSLGIEFVSYCEAIDTSTPVGKMTFTVLAAVAELERSLIIERVRAGVRNARAKGKRLGRPKVILDTRRIALSTRSGTWLEAHCRQLDCGVGTVLRIAGGSTIPPNSASASAVLSTANAAD